MTISTHALRSKPLVVAHRGVPGHRLEHTRDSYLLAVETGADVLETDLVVSADGVLVVRHDVELSATTDIAQRPEYVDRYRTLWVDGREVADWFVHDFTLDELRGLRCIERWPGRRPANASWDGAGSILTFDEVVALAAECGRRRGEDGGDAAPIPVWPELKRPTYFAVRGLDPAPLLVDALRRHGLDKSGAPVAVQCFEPTTLMRLAAEVPAPLVQLVEATGRPYDRVIARDQRGFAEMVTTEGLAEIATYASALGAEKKLVIPRDDDERLTEPTALVSAAHDLGLEVHLWTFRDENAWLPSELRDGDEPAGIGNAVGEYLAFFRAGVDAVFSDHTATAVEARRIWASTVVEPVS